MSKKPARKVPVNALGSTAANAKIEQPVLFPITDEAFEKLALRIVNEFELPDNESTRDFLATAILHAPQGAAAAPLSYLGSFVRKSLSNICVFEHTAGCKAKKQAEAQRIAELEKKKLAETNAGSADGQPVPNQTI